MRDGVWCMVYGVWCMVYGVLDVCRSLNQDRIVFQGGLRWYGTSTNYTSQYIRETR